MKARRRCGKHRDDGNDSAFENEVDNSQTIIQTLNAKTSNNTPKAADGDKDNALPERKPSTHHASGNLNASPDQASQSPSKRKFFDELDAPTAPNSPKRRRKQDSDVHLSESLSVPQEEAARLTGKPDVLEQASTPNIKAKLGGNEESSVGPETTIQEKRRARKAAKAVGKAAKRAAKEERRARGKSSRTSASKEEAEPKGNAQDTSEAQPRYSLRERKVAQGPEIVSSVEYKKPEASVPNYFQNLFDHIKKMSGSESETRKTKGAASTDPVSKEKEKEDQKKKDIEKQAEMEKRRQFWTQLVSHGDSPNSGTVEPAEEGSKEKSNLKSMSAGQKALRKDFELTHFSEGFVSPTKHKKSRKSQDHNGDAPYDHEASEHRKKKDKKRKSTSALLETPNRGNEADSLKKEKKKRKSSGDQVGKSSAKKGAHRASLLSGHSTQGTDF